MNRQPWGEVASGRTPNTARLRAGSREKNSRSPKPFTTAHFKAWAAGLVLDDDRPWLIEPFQARFVSDVFAGYRVCWLVVGEGNGKTTLIAGLGLYVIEHLREAYVPVAASSREQAEWIYRQAAGFVGRSELGDTFRCQEGYRRIRCDAMGSRIQVFAADDRSGDGVIPGGLAILDELHRHRDLRLYRTWLGKLEKRDAQLIVISTAGEAGGEFEQERQRLRTSGTVTRRGGFVRARRSSGGAKVAVLHEYAVPEDGDVEDLRQAKQANPFSGVTVGSLRRKRELPGMTLEHWSRFTCNRATRGGRAAVQEAEWERARRPASEWPASVPVDAGLDLGWKWDTTALVPLWVPEPTRRLLGPAEILVPPRDGSSLDPHLVEQALLDLHERNPIGTLVMDTTRGEQLAAWAEEELGVRVVDRQQTNQLACLDYARWMEALREGWLHHIGDEGLTRHVLNAVARILPGGDARFDRPAHNRRSSVQDERVIDALTAASMVHSFAVARLDDEPPEPPPILVAYV